MKSTWPTEDMEIDSILVFLYSPESVGNTKMSTATQLAAISWELRDQETGCFSIYAMWKPKISKLFFHCKSALGSVCRV